MLSQAVRKELEGELTQLRNRYKQIGEKIEALEKVLSPTDGFGFFKTGETTANATSETPQGVQYFNVERANPREQAKGLRWFMKTVLAKYPDGLKASDVVAKLMEMGYEKKGKTSLSAQVRGDLNRLRREEKIKRQGRKYVWPSETIT